MKDHEKDVLFVQTNVLYNISLSRRFLSFHEEIMDAQRCLFYIVLSNHVRSIL